MLRRESCGGWSFGEQERWREATGVGVVATYEKKNCYFVPFSFPLSKHSRRLVPDDNRISNWQAFNLGIAA